MLKHVAAASYGRILFGHLNDVEAYCLQQDLGSSRLDIQGEACRDFCH